MTPGVCAQRKKARVLLCKLDVIFQSRLFVYRLKYSILLHVRKLLKVRKMKFKIHHACLEHSVVESIVGIILEKVRVALVGHCCVDVIRYAFPILDELGIVISHRWLRRWIEAPEFRALVKVNLAVSCPYGSRIDVVGNASKPIANFLRIVTVHGRIDVPPVLRALRQNNFAVSEL